MRRGEAIRRRWATAVFLVAGLAARGAVPASCLAQDEERPDKRQPIFRPVLVEETFRSLLVDQLEYRASDGNRFARWDVEGWAGKDYNRIWIRTEGEQPTTSRDRGEAEAQLLYSRLVAPFWELQVGVRHQRLYGSGPDRSRTALALGFEGFAPYRFDVEPFLFISDGGDISGRLAATTELFFTQRLIAQPRFEVQFAARDVRDFGIASGINNVELGLRLRYEMRRESAPYLGISWVRKLGGTANLARRAGEDVRSLDVVIGVRLWF